ncbi:FecR protein [Pleomorphomonas diazotrophica]|nr:FecR family protein [Pleomorphomonas diazotrophica]SFN09807.1 FecR protein [Pleomorphomonas diazotrophica]
MRLGGVIGALALSGCCLLSFSALAADWQIASVTGKAFRLAGGDWVRVEANDAFALGDTVKTTGSGTLTLTRAGVTVTISPNSRVMIKERLDGTFTDVIQTAGSAEVEVDPKKRIRLAVETPYMAAVVKGTVFTVSTFEGYSETSVKRGRVGVIDVTNRMEADITAGQTATSGEDRPLSLTGEGKLAKPKAFEGKVVTRAADGTFVEHTNGAGKTVSSRAGGNSNGAGKSEDSNAGGNAGGNGNGSSGKGSSESGSNAGGNSGGSNSGNGGSNSGGNSGSNGGSSGSNNGGNGASSGSNSGSNGASSGSNSGSNGGSSSSNSGSNGNGNGNGNSK